jgi:hypothetical protein
MNLFTIPLNGALRRGNNPQNARIVRLCCAFSTDFRVHRIR